MKTMVHWHWSDYPTPQLAQNRWWFFLRSAEFLSTSFLAAYCVVFLLPGNTLAVSPAFNWLARISHNNEQPWAVMALALSITGPLAVHLDAGRLRIMSLISQGGYFLLFGITFKLSSPIGLGWITFVLSGLWLLWRAAMLLRHHLQSEG